MVKPATPCIQDVTLCSRDASRLWPYRSSAGKARPSLLSQPQRSVRSCHSRHSQSKHSVVSIAVVSIAGVSHCTLYDSNSPHYIPRTCTLYDSNSPHYLPRTCTLYERNSRLCASCLGLGLGLGLGSGSGLGLGLGLGSGLGSGLGLEASSDPASKVRTHPRPGASEPPAESSRLG